MANKQIKIIKINRIRFICFTDKLIFLFIICPPIHKHNIRNEV
jgi:hypothetical protein